MFGEILSDIQVPPAPLSLLARSLSRAGLDMSDDIPLRGMIDMRDCRPRTDLGPSATLCSCGKEEGRKVERRRREGGQGGSSRMDHEGVGLPGYTAPLLLYAGFQETSNARIPSRSSRYLFLPLASSPPPPHSLSFSLSLSLRTATWSLWTWTSSPRPPSR